MICWLYTLIVGRLCKHQWETVRIGIIYDIGTTDVVGHFYHLKCTKCGDVRIRKLS